ncbi:MAG: tetratricopeptide repeat protein [Nitrospinaceae bacterium]|nr:tetratricopeptide repeat protein [Nitrospinaceae bacterium]MBT3433811.1 tetratricopeptide repeat protein [Nitrospinaceae bacterium]MBT3822350.1 tetratricopeptide repeat protein [Nitrospinaceae bacterium]MBT4094107.1 tetratricopeptide repeat protein [Nitrospinaceae bacterium]MBT4431673.1 tetratricopeptide repeat protein [Nitrospinaceae bacterium]
MGYSLRHAGRISEAIAAYNRAVEINPGYAELREYRGKAYVLAGNMPAAMSDYRTLVAMGSPLAEALKVAIDRGASSAN